MLQRFRTPLLALAVISFNEPNRVFDLGFKALPWGNTGYLKSNLNAVGNTKI